MKLSNKQQTKLKLALLVALAANVSYTPIRNIMQETNLSAVAETGSGAPVSSETTQPTTPASEQKTLATRLGKEIAERDYLEACGGTKKHRVIFRQHTYPAVAGKPEETITIAYAQNIEVQDTDLTAGGAVKTSGPYTETKRVALISKLKDVVKQSYDCVGPVTAPKSDADKAADEAAKTARAELEKELKEQDAKARRCELKKTRVGNKYEYEAIEDREEMMRCQINRISRLEDEKDEKGKRRSKSATLSEAEKIVNDKLKRDIKKLLMSKDESENELGVELAEETIDALNDLGGGERRIEKLANMLRGFKAGGQTAKRSREREEEVSELRERVGSAREELRRDPRDLYAMRDLTMALYEHQNLANQIDYDIYYGPLATMQRHRSLGHLTTADYNDFLAPYNAIKRQMEEMLRQNPLDRPTNIHFSDLQNRGDMFRQRSALNSVTSSNRPLTMPDVRGQFSTSSVPSVFGGVHSSQFPF